MNKKVMVSFKLNGKETDVVVEPRELLIHTLREKCLHTGPHIGCETSHCGACTVDFDGMSVKSCTMLTVQAEGAEVLTVEGKAPSNLLRVCPFCATLAWNNENGTIETRRSQAVEGEERDDLLRDRKFV